ncbi:ATP-binding protein [Gordonia sputi]|uniref:ATP-binding protein n=1 Tax=Gordonia sputi TaxID=36823 RepID=UPI002042D472|nr:ATP-binding protein [Gordonia sputi]MCM3896984.1 ATP-binding protein [Gordonia sputi]
MATHTASSPTVSETARDALAGRRILRQFTLFAAAGYLLYGAQLAVPIAAASEITAPWYTPTAVLLTFGTGLAMAPLAYRAGYRRLQAITGISAIGYLITLALWWVAWDGGQIHTVQGLWLSMFPGLAAICAALAFRPAWAFVVLVVAVSGSIVADRLVRQAQVIGPIVGQLAWMNAFSMVFVVATIMGRRTARVLDQSRAEAYATTAAAAAAQARSAERARFDVLTHDSVMSTLLLAARRGTSSELVQDARNALASIDRAGSDDVDDDVGASRALSHIRAAVALVAPQQTVSAFVDDDAVRYPGAVVTALAASAAEAVRNSLRHAGPEARTRVRASSTFDRLTVEIIDTGTGFDPDAIPASRLGISVSIVGRMSKLDGASATIESQPGRGTTVRLSWNRTS